MNLLIAILLTQTYVPEQVSFGGELDYCAATGLSASIDVYHGIATGGPIFPNATGLGLVLQGRRRDGVAQVSVQSEVWVDGGTVFQVNAPFPCNFGAPPLFQCGPDGCSYGWATHPNCSGNSDVFAGGLMDASGVAGHFSFRSAPRNQLTIGGQLAKIQDAIFPNNEQPDPDLYPAGVVGTRDGGAHYFYYAGEHGSVTVADTSRMYAGLVLQLDNLEHPVNRHRAGFEAANGEYFQSHGLTREQFPSPVPLDVMTTIGFYHYFHESRLLYAFDTKHWYFANGSAWIQLAEQSDVYALQARATSAEARLAALEARVAVLEARCP